MDLSHGNNTTGGQQFVITRKEDTNNDIIKGALRINGLLDIAAKEKNETFVMASSNGGEGNVGSAAIDDNWLSDLMVMNTTTNNNVDKQTIVEQTGSIFTPTYHDNGNLFDKYLSQKTVQQQQQLQQQQSTVMDNEEFDSYFNELFPDLAL